MNPLKYCILIIVPLVMIDDSSGFFHNLDPRARDRLHFTSSTHLFLSDEGITIISKRVVVRGSRNLKIMYVVIE